MDSELSIEIERRKVGWKHPTYFVADIAANHDGDLERAKRLISLAADAGANAAKFQHFSASSIVSDFGFRTLGSKFSHQTTWKKSVFQVYKDASIDLRWTEQLKEACDRAQIAFFTSPYSFDLVDHVDPFVPAYKIGSGDITWIDLIRYIASKNKPLLLATGASEIGEVQSAVAAALAINPRLVLMQCNTNYTGDDENFKCIQLNVLRTYEAMYPHLILGLSDHTPGHATALGAVTLGARVIEKHFTDDTTRSGPDHRFSMDPTSWRYMVKQVRKLEAALGTGVKKVEDNERETVILQRRAIRVACDLVAGTKLQRENLTVLRPCPPDALSPEAMSKVLNTRVRRALKAGEHLRWIDLE